MRSSALQCIYNVVHGNRATQPVENTCLIVKVHLLVHFFQAATPYRLLDSLPFLVVRRMQGKDVASGARLSVIDCTCIVYHEH